MEVADRDADLYEWAGVSGEFGGVSGWADLVGVNVVQSLTMTAAQTQPYPPRPKRWTKQEYNELVDRGAFQGKRLYLFRGELIEMAPMGADHAWVLRKGTRILGDIFPGPKFFVDVQLPFSTPGQSTPEPDLAVCAADTLIGGEHASKAVLIIEVADRSIDHDRDKGLEYAAAGVEEYWIVDLAARCIEVYRNPVADASTDLGFRYQSVTVATLGDSISPLAAPNASISVADLLP
jgi:Uma2 family endonuclease